ncbi:MAG: peptide ABC transporter substrate-binding protein [Chloroflexi bacterium]|nr:peptide ABC transporter substrate-binding protein [Chloroflexota bacterium]
MRKGFVVLLVGLLVISSVLMTTAGSTKAQEPKVLYTALLPGDVKIDPSLASDANSITMLNVLYVGLTGLHDETVAIEPGVATEWTVSDDGLVYTFTLAQGVSWVHYDAEAGEVVQVMDEAGAPLTLKAQDFVYGITRTLNPNTGSEYSSVLAPWVVNGQESLAGEAVELGVKALDDYTLEITSPQPAGFLPMLYGLWMARPQLQSVVEEFGDTWTEAANYVSYGPYALKSWEHDVEVTLIKNPFWAETMYIPQAKIDEINFIYLEEPAQLTAYEAGELDWIATVPLADLDRMRAERSDQLVIGPGQCTYYYGFNVLKDGVSNVHLRRALSMAVDRDVIVQILNAGQVPAGFFTLPALAAAPHQEDYPDLAIWSDAAKAQEEFQAYLADEGITADQVPQITLQHNTSQAHATLAQAIQQMWKDTLGLEVQITTQDFAVHQETMRFDAPQIWRLGWCFDYPDTHNFLYDVFRFVGPDSNNHTNWENPEFQALLDEAKTMTDNAARAELYAQAEHILVYEDAVMIPIYYYTSIDLTQPYVVRTYAQTGNERFEKWDLSE